VWLKESQGHKLYTNFVMNIGQNIKEMCSKHHVEPPNAINFAECVWSLEIHWIQQGCTLNPLTNSS
jgi:hypothetical protein